MYEFHLGLWEWIWDNCQHDLFLRIRTDAVKCFENDNDKAKELFCSSIASVFLGDSGSMHIPKKVLGIELTQKEVLDALEDFQDLDKTSIHASKLCGLNKKNSVNVNNIF